MVGTRLFIRTFSVVVLLLVVLVSGTDLSSASGTTRLETVLEESGLGKADIRDLLRAYRGAVKVGVDEGRLERLIDQSLAGGMEVKYLVRGISLITSTALSGLPVSPVLNKFSEGMAKGVDGEELVEALEKRALSLNKARKLVSVLIYEDAPVGKLDILLVAVADALERGAREREIKKLFERDDLDFNRIILKIEKL